MLESCGETCGWTAAIISCLLFGSYSVPYKSDVSMRVGADPLVFQTYRTVVVFVASWSVLLLGAKLTFTPWGIASGFCWVPGGVSGVFAVRNAGLAVSQGIWSCVVVMVSISWGIFVFHENVSSKVGACLAAMLLMLGLVGMSYFSSPKSQKKVLTKRSRMLSYSLPYLAAEEGNGHVERTSLVRTTKTENGQSSKTVSEVEHGKCARDDEVSIPKEISTDPASYGSVEKEEEAKSPQIDFTVCGMGLTKYQAGIVAAIINGILPGTMLVPLHYAGPDTKGIQYVISQAIGAVIATVTLWFVRYLYNVFQTGSFAAAYKTLPSFHFGELWRPGFLAGTLYSIGNMCGILAVTGLGLGVGQSVGQASMLISGLWGLFWYKEVTGTSAIALWLLSAIVALAGVVWLSKEHQPI